MPNESGFASAPWGAGSALSGPFAGSASSLGGTHPFRHDLPDARLTSRAMHNAPVVDLNADGYAPIDSSARSPGRSSLLHTRIAMANDTSERNMLHDVRTPEHGGATLRDMIARSEEPFRLLVESVKDYAIILLDPTGHVVSWNSGAERIKGYAADEIVGQPMTQFYPTEAVESGFPQHELEVATREGRFEDENWRIRKDGSRFWANVVITALRDNDGTLVGFAKVTRDLTARREAEAQARQLAAEEAARLEATRQSEHLARLNVQLQQALAQAEAARAEAERSATEAIEAYKELDQFAYVTSHDLKAPLRGIANLAQWIQDDLGENLDEASAEHMRLLQGRVHRMEALIEAILAYSRAGRARAPVEPIETGAMVAEAIELLDPPANLRIDVAPDLPSLESERVPLEQVFMNLLGNAIKFSHGSCLEPRVQVGWRDAGEYIRFEIADNGPGIAPEFHERIWGIFQTLAARDKMEGTGIGLALVKKLVEGRGGTVSVESRPGQGATFRFTWLKTPQPGAHA
jgi:PAS domain S-box-containing protein